MSYSNRQVQRKVSVIASNALFPILCCAQIALVFVQIYVSLLSLLHS